MGGKINKIRAESKLDSSALPISNFQFPTSELSEGGSV